MRNLVEPILSRCHLCNGELRLKLVEPSREPTDKGMHMDIEVFICANCGNERAYKVPHNHYAPDNAEMKPPTNLGYTPESVKTLKILPPA